MTTYLVHRSDNVASAGQAARAFLESRPVEHNLILTLLRDRIRRPEPGRYWWVSESGEVRGMAVQSPRTFKALVTPMPLDAIGPLVDAVAAEAPELPGIIGEAATAATFAGAWTERRSTGAQPIEGQRLYRCDLVRPPEGVAGSMRPAVDGDHDLLAGWLHAFSTEVGEPAPDDPSAIVAAWIATGQQWVWQVDGEVVASAAISVPVVGAARIRFVFTPPASRGRGYAAAAVAALCALALGDGAPFGRVAACLLYTQLHNATANGVYRRIGFRSVAEVTSYGFGDQPPH